jgi:hypothetical protein
VISTPGFDWKRGLTQDNSPYYSRLKGSAICTSTCVLGLRERTGALGSSNLLDLVFQTLVCTGVFPSLSQSSEFLLLAPIFQLDICKALRRLSPSKSVGLDDIPSFVIKGCSEIFVPVLKNIFNLSLPQQYFPTVWKQAVIVPCFKNRQHYLCWQLQTHFYSQ